MNWYIASSMIAFVFSISLGFFVYIKNPRNLVNRAFFLFNIAVSIWNSAEVVTFLVNDVAFAYRWVQFSYFGAIFIVPFFARLIFLIAEIHEQKKIIRFTRFLFISAILLSIAATTPYFIKYIKIDPYYEEAGPLYILFALYFIIGTWYSLFQLFKVYKKAKTPYKKTQYRYLFISLVIAIAGAISFFITLIDPSILSIHFFIEIAYLSIFAYAILRYHLLDISIVIKRSTIYTIMIFFVTSIYLTVIFLFENILSKRLGSQTVIPRIIVSVILASTFLPIRDFLEKIIDRILFRTKYDYTEALHKFSEKLVTILDMRELMNEIIHTISRTLSVKYMVLFVHNFKSRTFEAKASLGFEEDIRDQTILSRHRLIHLIRKDSKGAIRSKLEEEFKYDKLKRDDGGIVEKMKEYNAELCIPLKFSDRIIGILTLSDKKSGQFYSAQDLNLLGAFANEAAIAFSNALAYNDLKKTYIGTLESFAKAIEAKDEYTKGHSDRVVKIAVAISAEMDLLREQTEILRYSGFLHDIGKIAIDDRILKKNGKLTDKEYDMIKKHPEIGESIIAPIEFLEDAKKIVRHHHERFDGNGYPDNLRGDEIPLLSRILGVADSFDAITSKRVYRDSMSMKDALEEIKRCSGTQFDPFIVAAFISAVSKGKIE